MANVYGLVTTNQKYGSGSFYAPFNTSRSKALRIDPVGSGDFSIAAGQDFYISVWIKYGTVNVSSRGSKYPIIKYGNQTNYNAGWELGLVIKQVGDGYSGLPYFRFIPDDTTGISVELTTYFNGSNGNLIQPTGGFDHWEVSRTNGVISFRFNGVNSTNTSTTYNGRIGTGINQYAVVNNVPDYKGIFVGSEQPYVINQDNGAYIDELFFARGVNSVQSTNIDSSINDGKLSTTAFLYNFNGTYQDTTGATQVLSTTNLTSTSTVTIAARKTTPTATSLQSRFVLQATSYVAPRIRSFSAALVSTTTVTAAGIKPVYGTGIALQPRFALTARQNANYPRPNGTWDASIASQPTWVNFRDLYIDSVTNPTITTYTTGAPGLAEYFSQTINFTPPYANNTPSLQYSYLPYTILGEINYSNIPQTPWTSYVGIGYRTTPTTVTVGVFSYSTDYSSYSLLMSVSYPNVYPPVARSLTLTKNTSTNNITLSSNGQSTSQALTQVIDWQNYNGQTWATGNISSVSGGTYSYSNSQTILDFSGQIVIKKSPDGKVYINGTGYTIGASAFDVRYSRGGLVHLYQTNTTTDLATLPTTYNFNPSYLVVPYGFNLLITRTGFNYASTVVSTNPYVVTDQSKILGLYDQPGYTDNTGTLSVNQAQLTSAFAVRPTASKAVRLSAAITARATVTVQLSRKEQAQAAVTSRFTQTTSATRALFGQVQLTSTSQVTAQVKQYKGTGVALQARATVQPNAIKTSRARSVITAFFTEVTTDIGTKIGRANLTSTSTVQVTARRLRDNTVQSNSAFTNVITAKKIVRTGTEVSSTSTLTAFDYRVRYASANLQVSAFEVTIDRKDVRAQANLQARFTITATCYILEYSRTVLNSNFALTVTPQATHRYQANLTDNRSQLTANGGYVRGAFVHLQVSAFELATGSKFTLEPRLQKIIEQETRIYLIKPEDRQLAIEADGVLTIRPETRILPVKQSNRVNIITGIKL